MFLKPSKMQLLPIIFIITLLIITTCSVNAKNTIPDSLDIIVKISRIDETLNVIEELMKADPRTNTPSPAHMLRGMLQGTDWIDHSRPIVLGIVLKNTAEPEISALIPFKESNNNFQAAFNASSGSDYYIISVPPISNGNISESLKNALLDVSRAKSDDSFSITMNVNKIISIYNDKIKESMGQLENMPANQEFNQLNISPAEIREMLQKSIDTLSEIETASIGLKLNKSIFQAFFEADTVQDGRLEKLFTSTGETVVLDDYSPQYQINFRSHSCDVMGMLDIMNNCFGEFYKRIGIDFSSIESVCTNFTGEMAGGVSFENGRMISESISVLKKGRNYADFIEKTYLPWLKKYSTDINKMLSKQMSSTKQQNFTCTQDSIVKGHKVYGIKVGVPFFSVLGQNSMNCIAKDKQIFEYDIRMTVVDNLLITAPNDKRMDELIQISGNFKEKKPAQPLMTINIDMAAYIKMLMGMAPAHGLKMGKLPEMGKLTLECKASNGSISARSSIMMDDLRKMIAWIKEIDFSNLRSAACRTELSCMETDAGSLNQVGNHEKARAVNENDAEYWWKKGVLCSTYGNDKAAIRYYKKAIEMDPNRIDAYFQLGISYGEIGDYQKAISLITKSLETDPQNGLYFYGRGRVYLLSGNEEKGVDDLKVAAALGSQDAYYYLQSRELVQN
jgi:hypothetical protein